MICKNCGRELKQIDKFCSKCGAKTELKTDENNTLADAIQKNNLKATINKTGKIKKSSTKVSSEEIIDKSKNSKRFVICGVIIIAIVVTAIAGFFIGRHNSVKKDEKLIVGTWKASSLNEEYDIELKDYRTKNYKYITFYSDGTGEVATVEDRSFDIIWEIDYNFEWNIINPNNSLYVKIGYDLEIIEFDLLYYLGENFLTIQDYYGTYTFNRISSYNSSNNSSSDGFTSNLFKSDEDRILGDWVLDTSGYGEGLDKPANLNRVIVEITFYSDGTCTVDGIRGSENGVWSIADGLLLKVQGEFFAQSFWNYNGFISEYDLDGDMLTVYGDDGDNYVYYRE